MGKLVVGGPMVLESRDRSIPPGAALVNLNQTLVFHLWAEILVKYVIKELVVSTHLKNISQNGNLPQIGVKIKNTVFETTIQIYCTLSVSLAQVTGGKQRLIGIRYSKYNHQKVTVTGRGAHTESMEKTLPSFSLDLKVNKWKASTKSSWWFQPSWKMIVKLDHFPKWGWENTKYLTPPL